MLYYSDTFPITFAFLSKCFTDFDDEYKKLLKKLKDWTSIRKRVRFKIQIIINRYSHIFSKDIYMVNVYNSILTYKVRRIIKNNVIVS
jgi:hypothetical protein